MEELPVNERMTIPADELRLAFSRSGGPGGQNVNKVETKVELRWNLPGSRALSAEDRDWLLGRLGPKLTSEGDLLITSSRTRDQMRNREDARAKLVRVLTAALERPKRRKRTKPGRAAVERRIDEKKQRSQVKERRRPLRGE